MAQEAPPHSVRDCAVACNNEGWGLAEQDVLDAAEVDRLLNVAHTAAHHWAEIGTPLHGARADVLLSRAHARAGSGRLALRFAQRSHDFLVEDGCPDWEHALVAAAVADGHRLVGNDAAFVAAYAAAASLINAVADPQDRAIVDATFATIPAPQK